MLKENMESFVLSSSCLNLIISVLRDAPEPWQLGFQDAASPVMEEIIFFHDQIMFILTIILTTVL